MKNMNINTTISVLGPARIPSPLTSQGVARDGKTRFMKDEYRISVDVRVDRIAGENKDSLLSFEQAGPREKIYFDPSKLKCAVVTCGGLCPGLNDIIRSLVLELYHVYGVKTIYGIRHGLQGFIPKYGHDLIELNPERVSGIQNTGGSMLGSSRGG
ncbi:MAG: 6-phosphofructokinase 1, partial [Thermodesulfobacteriota bacterium]|nr:6-phosphofructokinase 1 [Thermodesulfobacteriota bacterium]